MTELESQEEYNTTSTQRQIEFMDKRKSLINDIVEVLEDMQKEIETLNGQFKEAFPEGIIPFNIVIQTK